MFRFKCTCCDQWHEGMSAFGADAHIFLPIPAEQRGRRCHLETDICIVDQQYFFVRGCLEIPVIGELDPFSWGVWVA
jgi:hypothetical protein